MPTPSGIDFTPGELLGCVSGALGLREFLESGGHQLVVTSDKEGADSEFERELPDADVVISQPFWPAYLTAERIAKAPNLKLALTAGIGSDHVDLDAAIARGITVAEVTFCNSISVAEHAVMQILALVRNFVPSHQWATDGGWNIADYRHGCQPVVLVRLIVLKAVVVCPVGVQGPVVDVAVLVGGVILGKLIDIARCSSGQEPATPPAELLSAVSPRFSLA